MIEAKNLSKQFEDFWAVSGVSFTVKPGEVMALLGPNGAGKTTTIRMLTSILTPTLGQARVAGHDVVAHPDLVRASVGVLTEQHGLYERMPAEEYLHFFAQMYGLDRPTRQDRIRVHLENFGLYEFRKRRIGHYSKGMRQKLALVRALLHDPPVLLLDEPTSAMDPESARLVRDALHDLRSANRAILLCTHNLPEAEELADHIAIISRGKIIARGQVPELKRSLLGPSEYEVRLDRELTGQTLNLPPKVVLTHTGPDWFRYQVDCPAQENPHLLENLFEQGLRVVSLHEVQRSLEQVYLQAVSAKPSEVPYAQ